jgi:hypothetical protein
MFSKFKLKKLQKKTFQSFYSMQNWNFKCKKIIELFIHIPYPIEENRIWEFEENILHPYPIIELF